MTLDRLAARRRLVSHLLRLEFGDDRSPCWGLVEPLAASVDYAEARREFARYLISELKNLISPSDAILLVGRELAPIREALAGEGIRADLAGDLPWAESAAYDVALVAGSFHYREQLAILTELRCCLKPGAHLLTYGEFLGDDSGIAPSPLANISSFRQLSERLGFDYVGPQNLTNSARRTIAELTRLVDKHRSALLKADTLDGSDLQAGIEELESAAREFAAGRRCLQLFSHVYRPDENDPYPELEYGDIDSFDPPEVAELFQRSFDKEFDEELWRWKYGLGKGTCVVARMGKEGKIIAHYGGAPREIDYFGRDQMAIQPCDVMVLPEERREYGRKSLFFKVAATFLEREIGNTVGHLLGFGFPNQKAMNIALRLGLYEKTDDFVELQYPPADPRDALNFDIEPFQVSDAKHRAAAAALWQAMREGFRGGIIGKRHPGYLDYRYFRHPGARRSAYQPLLVAREGKARAIAVLQATAGGSLLMDLVCPLPVMPEVIQALNQWLAGQEPGGGLRIWITRNWAGALGADGVIERKLGIEIPCNSWNPGPSSETLYGAWWLTAGDMDFM